MHIKNILTAFLFMIIPIGCASNLPCPEQEPCPEIRAPECPECPECTCPQLSEEVTVPIAIVDLNRVGKEAIQVWIENEMSGSEAGKKYMETGDTTVLHIIRSHANTLFRRELGSVQKKLDTQNKEDRQYGAILNKSGAVISCPDSSSFLLNCVNSKNVIFETADITDRIIESYLDEHPAEEVKN